MRRTSLSSFLLMLAACAPRTIPTPATPYAPKPLPGSYLDLERGWRLRVIAPLVKGGGFHVKTEAISEHGNTLTLKASLDFEGYETAYYDILTQAQIRFTQAEATRDGKPSPQLKPVHPIFQNQKGMTVARIVYLKRGSDTVHDMAILAAHDLRVLDEATIRLQNSPTAACGKTRRVACEWVPAGIAVRAEIQKSGAWLPAR